MKRLIIALLLTLALSLTSCTGWVGSKAEIHRVKGVVLDRNLSISDLSDTYTIYFYDGTSAEWMYTDKTTYDMMDKGDSLEVILVERTYYKEK